MDPTVRTFLLEAWREVVPMVKNYYMADMDGKIAARNIELARTKASEQLAEIGKMQFPQTRPAGTLEAKVVEEIELLDPKKAVGRATWNDFHTRAAHFPDQPTPEQQEAMRTHIISAIAAFPCTTCASWGLDYIEAHPIDTSSRAALKKYLCDFHNAKNVDLGKPAFECAAL